jgi:prolyl oligopeptidase family protein
MLFSIDSIYTERYMDLPQKNPGGYINTSITNMTGFRDTDFLLAHGSGDDNVHFANSAHLLDMFTSLSQYQLALSFKQCIARQKLHIRCTIEMKKPSGSLIKSKIMVVDCWSTVMHQDLLNGRFCFLFYLFSHYRDKCEKI